MIYQNIYIGIFKLIKEDVKQSQNTSYPTIRNLGLAVTITLRTPTDPHMHQATKPTNKVITFLIRYDGHSVDGS